MPLPSRSLSFPALVSAAAAALVLALAPASFASIASAQRGPDAQDRSTLLARGGGGGGGYGLGGGKSSSSDFGGGGKGSKAFDPYGKDDPYSSKATKGNAFYGGKGDGDGGHHKAVQQSFHGPNRDRPKATHDRGGKQRGDDDQGYDHGRNVDHDRDSPKVRGGTTADDSSSGSGDDSQ